MNICVTGATGFAGSHLVDLLLARRPADHITVFARWRSHGYMANLAHLPSGAIDLAWGDLTDPWSVRRIIQDLQPYWLFHVAAHTHVPYSYGSPTATLDTNAQGTINLLEALRTYAPACKTLIVSSGEVYGHHDDTITESSALNPRSPYGLGKLAEDRAAYMYQQAYGLPILIARAFSQSGPRKFEGLMDSSWSQQIARMERSTETPILYHGTLDTIRTFCDVQDMVEAYLLFMERGEPGDLYNINGFDTIVMAEIVTHLRGMTSVKFEQQLDPKRLRPTDVGMLRPSCEPFKQRFGWRPTTPYWTSLLNLLNYWRARV